MMNTTSEPLKVSNTDSYTLVVLGGPGVGKSSLTMRLVSDTFESKYDPTIENKCNKTLNVDGKECELSNS